MDRLNYHHLLYFWTVAKAGSMARASSTLRLAQPTLSSQIKTLEAALGLHLFTREGRRLVLTDTGRTVFQYANEIFERGEALTAFLTSGTPHVPLHLTVGVVDILPKLSVPQFLKPLQHLPQPVHLICREEKTDRLAAELLAGRLDLALSDTPLHAGDPTAFANRLVGECDIEFLAIPALAARFRTGFPRSLEGAPLLMPFAHTALRRSLDHWLHQVGVRPRIVGEFLDSAVLQSFGQAGVGLFPSHTLLSRHTRHQYRAVSVGRVRSIRERFYAITTPSRLAHPAIAAIWKAFPASRSRSLTLR